MSKYLRSVYFMVQHIYIVIQSAKSYKTLNVEIFVCRKIYQLIKVIGAVGEFLFLFSLVELCKNFSKWRR